MSILRRTVRLVIIRTVLLLGVASLTMVFHVVSVARLVPVVPTHDESMATSLLEAHNCWSGPAPADMQGKIPGHVVVGLADGRVVYDAAHVGPALDHQFNDVDNDVATVAGFCR